jgi:hypothetical protein|tara:strand:- start:1888 stop:2556 length:669 start_codon:yes stop_codon:yes gene_type:complete
MIPPKNKYFSETPCQSFPNEGWVEVKLSNKIMEHLKECIKKQKTKKFNHQLVGHIDNSFKIKDKNNFFSTNVLFPLSKIYFRDYGNLSIPQTLTHSCKSVLQNLWVNFQKKHEFNPPHFHSGIFSFVVWMTIPTDYKKEHALKFVNHSSSPQASDFQFMYLDSLGHIKTHNYKLSSESEGTMLFFPAKLMHQVFPFYTSNKERISISGNIALDTEKSYVPQK